jgi:hypothetical protein
LLIPRISQRHQQLTNSALNGRILRYEELHGFVHAR